MIVPDQMPPLAFLSPAPDVIVVYERWLGTCEACGVKAVFNHTICDTEAEISQTIIDCLNCGKVSGRLIGPDGKPKGLPL